MENKLKEKISNELVKDMDYCNEVIYRIHDTIVNDNATPLTTSVQAKKVISELRLLRKELNKELNNL